MMSQLLVFGLQWGDEGKGKIVDCMAGHFDAVARFQGGRDAGRAVIVKREKKIPHLRRDGAECRAAEGIE